MSKNNFLRIAILGIGGAGNNALSTFVSSSSDNNIVDTYAINTDSVQLEKAQADNKLLIGQTLTNGRGCGGDPKTGELCVIREEEAFKQILVKYDIVFLTAGLGGGTGSGAISEIARLAREYNNLVISVVTKPFNFEGDLRKEKANDAYEKLMKHSDCVVLISNDKLMFSTGKLPVSEAFRISDKVLSSALRTITTVLNNSGEINIDFADIKSSLTNKGLTLFNQQRASGPNKIQEASKLCTQNNLLEYSIKNANTLILYLRCSSDITMDEVSKCTEYFREQSCNSCNILFGYEKDETLVDEVEISVIATDYKHSGFEKDNLEYSRVHLNSLLHKQNETTSSSVDVDDIIPRFLKKILDKKEN